jgi:hypothetical protein
VEESVSLIRFALDQKRDGGDDLVRDGNEDNALESKFS